MIQGNLFPIYFIDPPCILDTSVTPIPGSGGSPLPVVVDSGSKAAYGINYIDTSGDYVGVYIGAPGQETLRTIIGGGLVSATPVVIPANSRISLRSMTATPITYGKLTITFLGQGWDNRGSS